MCTLTIVNHFSTIISYLETIEDRLDELDKIEDTLFSISNPVPGSEPILDRPWAIDRLEHPESNAYGGSGPSTAGLTARASEKERLPPKPYGPSDSFTSRLIAEPSGQERLPHDPITALHNERGSRKGSEQQKRSRFGKLNPFRGRSPFQRPSTFRDDPSNVSDPAAKTAATRPPETGTYKSLITDPRRYASVHFSCSSLEQ